MSAGRILLPTGTKNAKVQNPPRNISVSNNFVDFRSVCVSYSIPAVVPLILSPLLWCYHTYSTHYRDYPIEAVPIPVVTAVISQHVVPITGYHRRLQRFYCGDILDVAL